MPKGKGGGNFKEGNQYWVVRSEALMEVCVCVRGCAMITVCML